MLAAEWRWAVRCCWVAPLAAVTAGPWLAKHLLFLVYLKPVETGWAWQRWITWAPFWLIVVAMLLVPMVWLAALAVERRWRWRWLGGGRLPVGAVSAVVLVALVGTMLNHPRGRWFFAEWAKLRTENPSYARNVLFWHAEDFPQAGNASQSGTRIGIAGSSQINFAVDHQLLAQLLTDARVEKNCLAGFGPMNYLTLIDRIADRGHTDVVCWLSEFDMFRETGLPADRLRWCMAPRAWIGLWGLLSPAQRWSNRAELADLAAAAWVPLWQHRQHVRRTMFGYWWDISRPEEPTSPGGAQVLARMADAAAAQENVRRNIGRTELVELNFDCFERFARELTARGIRLLVVEGSSHPQIMRSYDPTYRGETRQRLSAMADAVGFRYLSSDQLPALDADDFIDPYHLGDDARTDFTGFLAECLQAPSQDGGEGVME
jgi:hypothetical protein